MTKYSHLIGIMFVLIITSCDQPTVDLSEYRAGLFVNSWVHNWDEKCTRGNLMVFDSFESSPDLYSLWMLRNRLELFADSTARYTVATPIDPHLHDPNHKVNGKWRYDANSNTLLVMDPGGKIYYSFNVVAVSEERLILRYQEITNDGKAH